MRATPTKRSSVHPDPAVHPLILFSLLLSRTQAERAGRDPYHSPSDANMTNMQKHKFWVAGTRACLYAARAIRRRSHAQTACIIHITMHPWEPCCMRAKWHAARLCLWACFTLHLAQALPALAADAQFCMHAKQKEGDVLGAGPRLNTPPLSRTPL